MSKNEHKHANSQQPRLRTLWSQGSVNILESVSSRVSVLTLISYRLLYQTIWKFPNNAIITAHSKISSGKCSCMIRSMGAFIPLEEFYNIKEKNPIARSSDTAFLRGSCPLLVITRDPSSQCPTMGETGREKVNSPRCQEV